MIEYSIDTSDFQYFFPTAIWTMPFLHPPNFLQLKCIAFKIKQLINYIQDVNAKQPPPTECSFPYTDANISTCHTASHFRTLQWPPHLRDKLYTFLQGMPSPLWPGLDVPVQSHSWLLLPHHL